jgi:hypothetical protein
LGFKLLPTSKFKRRKKKIVARIIYKVLRDLTFSRIQPLKSAEDKKTGSLKNKIKKTYKVLDELKRTKI